MLHMQAQISADLLCEGNINVIDSFCTLNMKQAFII